MANDLYARFGEMLAHGTLPKTMVLFVVFALFSSAIGILRVWRPQIFRPLAGVRVRLGWLCWVIAPLVSAAACVFFLYSRYSDVFSGTYVRLFIYGTAYAWSTWLLVKEDKTTPEDHFSPLWRAMLAAAILMGIVFVFANAFRELIDYPFGLYWSEGNRFWDYSVLYGKRLYDIPPGESIKAYIDIGRQSLWGLPFLFGNPTILGMRLWNALVFSVPYLFLGWVMLGLRRKTERAPYWFFFGLWGLLFLNQGPIYTPLVLAAVLVAATRRFPGWVAFGLVFVAGYYARMSRLTWLMAPVTCAVLITMLEGELNRKRWQRAILLAVGGLLGGYLFPDLLLPWLRSLLNPVPAAAVAPQAVSKLASGSGISELFGRQPLLWDRLWPNSTNSLGIVYSLLLATGPLLALVIYLIASRRWKLNFWQVAAFGGALSVFLGVGVIVSVKIGGGSNLHNVDMFLIGLFFVAALAWEKGGYETVLQPRRQPWWALLLVLAAVIYPAGQGLLGATPLITPNEVKVKEAMDGLYRWTGQARSQGEILFMDQRQLLTFGVIKDIPLVAEYEKKEMMDYAMADDGEYFEPFIKDMAEHRFALIVTEPLRVNWQGGQYNFGNENDSWVKWVSIPVLCYYQPVETYEAVGVQILIPKEKSSPDPAISCPDGH